MQRLIKLFGGLNLAQCLFLKNEGFLQKHSHSFINVSSMAISALRQLSSYDRLKWPTKPKLFTI